MALSETTFAAVHCGEESPCHGLARQLNEMTQPPQRVHSDRSAKMRPDLWTFLDLVFIFNRQVQVVE